MMPSTGARALPPFLIGAALAISSVVAAGLLLYGGVGLVQALVVVLATHFAALGFGLAGGRPARGSEPVEHLRRRWLLLLFSFSLAAVFSGLWEAFQGLGGRGLTQGVGLALLVALPQYAGGAVLGSLRHLPGALEGFRGPAPAALFGGATGVIVFGFVLFPNLTATATLLACLVGLSAAALVQGSLLDEAARSGDPITPLDRILEEAIPRWHPSPRTSLVLGGGAAPAALGPLLASENSEVHLVDPDPALLDACAALATRPEARGILRTHLGSFAGLLLEATGTSIHSPLEEGLPEGPFDLVLLHAEALAPFAPAPELPPGALSWLAGRLAPGGVLVVAPLLDDAASSPILARARPIAGAFPSVSLYVGPPAGEVPLDSVLLDEARRSRVESRRTLLPGAGVRGAILVAGTEPEAGWPERVGDVVRVHVEERLPEAAPFPGEAGS